MNFPNFILFIYFINLNQSIPIPEFEDNLFDYSNDKIKIVSLSRTYKNGRLQSFKPNSKASKSSKVEKNDQNSNNPPPKPNDTPVSSQNDEKKPNSNSESKAKKPTSPIVANTDDASNQQILKLFFYKFKM